MRLLTICLPPTLAELYAPDAGYPDLVKAHAALDKAVDKAYGYKKRQKHRR